MSNCMDFSLEFYLNKSISNEIINGLNVIINRTGDKFNLPENKFFTEEDWADLFVKYNGYPEFKKVFSLSDDYNQYYVYIKCRNREDKRKLLDSFLNWINPFIDITKNENEYIGTYECDSFYNMFLIKKGSQKIEYVNSITDDGWNY